MSVSLLCLIGLPGSGKTILAESLKTYFAENGVNAECIEYDMHIEEIHCTDGEWKRQRHELLESVRRVAGEFKKSAGKSVIVLDDNFYYRSMRYEVYRIAKEFRLGFGQIFLNLPYDLCCSRNSSRPKPVPSEVMSRMKSLFEPPDASKNAWERHSLIISNTPSNLEGISELVTQTWEQPYFPVSQTVNSPQPNSAIHFADLALRQIVKSIILSTQQEQRSQITQTLSHKKKSVLEDIKMNNIALPFVDSNVDIVAAYVMTLEPYFSDFLNKYL